MSLVVFYWTGLFQLALQTHTGHLLMTAHFVLAGYLFAWVLVGVDPGPKRWSPALRLVVLFATIAFHAFFGVAMISGTTLLGGDFFPTIAIPWVGRPAGRPALRRRCRLGHRRAAEPRARPDGRPAVVPHRPRRVGAAGPAGRP